MNQRSSVNDPGCADRRRGAFTLVEVLVVCMLIGLAATLMSVGLQSPTNAARLRGAHLELETLLRTARQWSRTNHVPSWLEIDRVGSRWRWFGGELSSVPARWYAREGVTMARAERVGVRVAVDHATDSHNPQTFRVRMGPSGATLPWQVELRSGTLKVSLAHDGVSEYFVASDEASP